MASSFRVETEGLKDLIKSLDSITPKIARNFNQEALKLRKTIREEVSKRYTLTNIESVLTAKSNSNVIGGRKFIESSLVYQFKPIPLSNFPLIESDVGRSIRPVDVKVLRKKSYKLVKGRKGFKGFLIKPTRAKSGNPQRRGIYERQQKDTWLSPKNRAPIKPLFGPSYSQMVATVFKTSKRLQNITQQTVNNIRKRLQL